MHLQSTLENKSIFSCFLSKGFLLKEDKINEVKDLILKFRAVIEPLLQSWINEQRCNKLEDITNFESRMEYFAELLKNAGYEKEAKYALEHIEHEKQKPFLKIKVVHSGIEHLEEEFKNDVDYYGYRKTANLIEECKNLLGRLQVQIEQDLSSNYISGIHLIKKSVEQFIRSVVA